MLKNVQIAALLDEIARWRQLRGDNPFRVGAYRRAAQMVRSTHEPLTAIYQREGIAGLRKLPGVGSSLARRLSEIVRTGRSRMLERLQGQTPSDVLASVPQVGPRLADRIRTSLGAHSLEELLRAARDGRLQRVAGMGRKRVETVRECLTTRLQGMGRVDDMGRLESIGGDDANEPVAAGTPSGRDVRPRTMPPVSLLLEIDRQYLRQVQEGTLLRAAPRKFNPAGVAWLPILHTRRSGRRYRAHFTNSARGHALGQVRDWVVILCEDKAAFGQWTVVTAAHGPLRGKRVIRGRERECLEHYGDQPRVQRRLPSMD